MQSSGRRKKATALNPRIPQQEGYSNFETEQASKRCRVCVPLSDRSRRMEFGNTEALKSLMCWRQKQTHMQRMTYWQERCRAYAIPLIYIHSQGGGHCCLTSQTMQRAEMCHMAGGRARVMGFFAAAKRKSAAGVACGEKEAVKVVMCELCGAAAHSFSVHQPALVVVKSKT